METAGFVAYLVISIICIVVVALLWVLALVQVAKTTTLDPTAKALWVLIVLVFPVLGAIVWFAIGAKSASNRIE